MAYDPTSEVDAAALSARQARVRAWSLRIAGAVEAIPMPQSYRDGERAARAVTVADRMLARLPQLNEGNETPVGVSPARQRLRIYADDLFATVEALPLPKTFIEGERAGRCVLATDRLFVQLYTPPKPLKNLHAALAADPDTPESAEEDAIDIAQDEADADAALGTLFDHIDRLTLAFARETGFYPDGTACDPAAPQDPARLSCPTEHDIVSQWLAHAGATPYQRGEGTHFFAVMITARANASTRAQACASGEWPDGSGYRDDAPDFWAISKAFPAEVLQKPGPQRAEIDEAPGPGLFPWWLVRNPDTG